MKSVADLDSQARPRTLSAGLMVAETWTLSPPVEMTGAGLEACLSLLALGSVDWVSVLYVSFTYRVGFSSQLTFRPLSGSLCGPSAESG